VTAAVARAARWACAVALLLFVANRCLVPMDETDLFFNLRLGEIILHDHAVPRTNLLSFTYPDARDVNLAWLFQIVLALAHRAGGIAGTLLLKTAFVLATLAVLYRVALRRGAHPAAAALALALSAWAAEPRFVERPHLVTFLGLALTLLALERTEADRPRALWALIPCGLVWANANSCFFEAPLVLALYAAGAYLDCRPADGRRAGRVALALVPLIFATPSGIHALGYIANHWRMPWLRPLQEYDPARWPDNAPAAFVAAGVVLAAALSTRRWRQLFPLAFLGLLGARRNRFLAEFALLAGPVVAYALTDVAGRLTAGLIQKWRARLSALVSVVTFVPLAGFPILMRVGAAHDEGPVFDLKIDTFLVPWNAINFVNREGLRERMYNDMEIGSYLTWDSWPRYRVFQDPRINGYPSDFHARMRRDDLTRAEWDTLLDGFGVKTALLTYPDVNPRAAFFDPDRWALIYRGTDAFVFVRRLPEFAALTAREEEPVTFAFARDKGVTSLPIERPPPGSPVAECEWQRRLALFFELDMHDLQRVAAAYRRALAKRGCLDEWAEDEARQGLGDAALSLNDPATAAEAYAGIDLPRVHINRGLALLALGRAREALEEARRALAQAPEEPDALRVERLARERLAKSGP